MLQEKIRDTLKAGVTYQKAKVHFVENQKFYIGVATGAAVTLIVVRRGQQVHNTPIFNITLAVDSQKKHSV